MEEKKRVIRIRARMSDPKGVLIPRGIMEQITIDIGDEVATYYFKNKKVTKNFATVEIEGDKAKGIEPNTVFIERIGKAIRRYPEKNKEEIRDIILNQLKELGVNARTRIKDGK